MTSTTVAHGTALFMAIDMGESKWTVAFAADAGKVRGRILIARDQAGMVTEIKLAKQKLGLPADAPVYSCYEAGRDGFWFHRMLTKLGVINVVVDPASIEVNRRQRRLKTDRLDAKKLVGMLARYHHGERDLWKMARVPEESAEDARRLHRERERLMKERGGHRNRIWALLALHGVSSERLPDKPQDCRDWEGKVLPKATQDELMRECSRLEMVEKQLDELESAQRAAVKAADNEVTRKTAKLMELRSVGIQTSWVVMHEVFGWRKFDNQRQVGAMAGLTGTAHSSGDMQKELGISKAGNRRIRHVMIEEAWLWLRYQPDSALTKWYQQRFGVGKRARRVGIVALARRLLITFWRYVEFGIVPEGAIVRS